MKTIIAITLLVAGMAGAAWGMATRLYIPIVDKENIYIISNPKDTSRFAVNRQYQDTISLREHIANIAIQTFDSLLLARLVEYETDCWNDSTKHRWNMFAMGGDTSYAPEELIDPGFSPGWEGEVDVWTHRKPTFSGFIRWLKGRKEGR